MARFRVVSKHQVSGWRFLLRRIEHALVRRDASMVDDPGRGRATALTVGVALACVCIAGAAVMAFFKPQKVVGTSPIVADKDTGAVYVHMGDRLYPALNLTSARLITGNAANPVKVPTKELEKHPRGPMVGIPGAPGHMIPTNSRESNWAVCDRARIGPFTPLDPQTGLPTAAAPPAYSTAIGTKLTIDFERTRPLGGNEARLLRDDNTVWLVYRGPDTGVVRAAINLAESAVTLALGIDATQPVVTASKGLIGAIPEVPALKVPQVPGAGTTVTLTTGMIARVGSVLTVATPDRPASYYLVTQSGVVQVSPVLAAMVRNADANGSVSMQSVGPNVVAANLRPGGWSAAATYPTRAVDLVDPGPLPITCSMWERGSGDQSARTNVLVGRQLPLKPEEQAMAVGLVTAPNSRGATADSAFMPRTTGRFVQVTGADPSSPLRESLWWVSDSGVRFGIDAQVGQATSDGTLQALALGQPVPAPWSVISLFARGPTLSQRDAKMQHDGIAPNRTGIGFGKPS